MSILTVAKTVLSVLPIITDVLKSVEEISTDAGNGAYKKQLALSIIEVIYNQSEPAIPFKDLVTQISATVDAVVNFYNSIGVFVKAIKQ